MKNILSTALLLALVSGWAAQGHADDSGYWGAYLITIPVVSKIDFAVRPELRFNDDMSQFYYSEVQSGLIWHAHKHLDLAAHFVIARNKNVAKGTFHSQYIERPEITPKWTLLTLPMSARNRFEFRQMDGGTDRYRGRLLVNAPKAYTPMKLSPYVSDEFFYDFDLKQYNQNRLIGGVVFPVDTRIDLALYFMRQSQLGVRGGWGFTNILGSEFRWTFR